MRFALRMCSRLRGDEPPIRAVIPIRLAALCAADCATDSLPGSEVNPARMCGGVVPGWAVWRSRRPVCGGEFLRCLRHREEG